MREENPIAAAGIGARSEVLAAYFHKSLYADVRSLSFPGLRIAVGIGGMLEAIGGMLIADIVGHVLQWTGSYLIPFFIAASASPLALFLIHTLSPRLEPAVIGEE
jgi:nitrate/nitrite transporter NarK